MVVTSSFVGQDTHCRVRHSLPWYRHRPESGSPMPDPGEDFCGSSQDWTLLWEDPRCVRAGRHRFDAVVGVDFFPGCNHVVDMAATPQTSLLVNAVGLSWNNQGREDEFTWRVFEQDLPKVHIWIPTRLSSTDVVRNKNNSMYKQIGRQCNKRWWRCRYNLVENFKAS